MKAMLACVLGCILLGGCALPTSRLDNSFPANIQSEALLRLTIERFGKERFSGLLLLRLEPGGINYVLLDASGIKLLEARVDAFGGSEIIRALGPLKEHRLPGLLAQALSRIYGFQPAGQPCGRNLFMTLCLEQTADKVLVKKAAIGGMVLWTVIYGDEQARGGWNKMSYANGWQGVRLMLTALD